MKGNREILQHCDQKHFARWIKKELYVKLQLLWVCSGKENNCIFMSMSSMYA